MDFASNDGLALVVIATISASLLAVRIAYGPDANGDKSNHGVRTLVKLFLASGMAVGFARSSSGHASGAAARSLPESVH